MEVSNIPQALLKPMKCKCAQVSIGGTENQAPPKVNICRHVWEASTMHNLARKCTMSMSQPLTAGASKHPHTKHE